MWTQSESSRMGGVVVGQSLLALALSACQPQFPYSHELPNCGWESSDGFDSSGVDKTVDEGNGRISFISSYSTDTLEGWVTFNLVDCPSGEAAGVTASTAPFLISAEEERTGVIRPRPTLGDMIERLRAKGAASDFAKLVKAGKTAGYETESFKARSSLKAAVCACELYYSDTTGPWAKE